MLLKAALFLAIISQVYGHTFHFGPCPNVQPMGGFNIKRFLGKWYVIEKSSTTSHCLVNKYFENPVSPGQYLIELISKHFFVGFFNPDHLIHRLGYLFTPDPAKPGAMEVRFPLNFLGGFSYTIFMTDYDTYAGIFTCQRLPFSHIRSTSILSRHRNLSSHNEYMIRQKLSSFGISPDDLSIIRRDDCNEHDEAPPPPPYSPLPTRPPSHLLPPTRPPSHLLPPPPPPPHSPLPPRPPPHSQPPPPPPPHSPIHSPPHSQPPPPPPPHSPIHSPPHSQPPPPPPSHLPPPPPPPPHSPIHSPPHSQPPPPPPPHSPIHSPPHSQPPPPPPPHSPIHSPPHSQPPPPPPSPPSHLPPPPPPPPHSPIHSPPHSQPPPPPPPHSPLHSPPHSQPPTPPPSHLPPPPPHSPPHSQPPPPPPPHSPLHSPPHSQPPTPPPSHLPPPTPHSPLHSPPHSPPHSLISSPHKYSHIHSPGQRNLSSATTMQTPAPYPGDEDSRVSHYEYSRRLNDKGILPYDDRSEENYWKENLKDVEWLP